ncbi:O-acyltransferase like protein-like [Prorops nasuta]|uniref:O-acyltransferase like protein-like n=1 Tax=Prorops nasuta TaxID=863751 RepID=UPI0034CF3141
MANSRARVLSTVLLLVSTTQALMSPTKPEILLFNVLNKPFVPSDWASPQCLKDSHLYLQELARYTPWALLMYDASAKVPSGMITGNYMQLGNYDECLRINSGHGFMGQACSASVQFEVTPDAKNRSQLDMGDLLQNIAIAAGVNGPPLENSVIYEWTWCVPSSCNSSEIQEALEIALDALKVDGRVDLVVHVPQESCRTLESDKAILDTYDWIYISLLVIIAIAIVISTIYDLLLQRWAALAGPEYQHGVMIAFSLYSNGKNIFRTDRLSDSIGCLDGLRFLSICWIIYGHTCYNEAMDAKIDLERVPQMHHNWINMLALNGNIATDTFFLLSGILLAYTSYIKWHRNTSRGFDVIGLYVHRYMRVTPAYAMMIGLYATLFYKFGSGPHWNTWVGVNRDFCKENWWTNLLYINNYVNTPKMCMSQSWYLSVDMQLFWLSPIFLYPMLKFTRSFVFWIIIGLGIVLSILFPFLVTFCNELTGTMLYYREQVDVANVYLEIYTKTYNRAGPYIIGLAFGYILARTRKYSIKVPVLYVLLGWITAAIVAISVIFGPISFYQENHVYNRLEASFYAGLHRNVFALAVSWIIFCCCKGYAGPVEKFLSWRGWIPCSKLTFSAYLCHFLFLLSKTGAVRAPTTLQPLEMVRVFFSHLMLTMLLAIVWSLSFELPFMMLDRSLTCRWKRRSQLLKNKNQSKFFGSMDSKRQFCRSMEDTSSTVSQTYNDERTKTTSDSVYDSAVNISFCIDADNLDEAKVENVNSVVKRPSYIYVIDSSDYTRDLVNGPSRANHHHRYVNVLAEENREDFRIYSSGSRFGYSNSESMNDEDMVSVENDNNYMDEANDYLDDLENREGQRKSHRVSQASLENRKLSVNSLHDDFHRGRSIAAFHNFPRKSCTSSNFGGKDFDHVITRASVYNNNNNASVQEIQDEEERGCTSSGKTFSGSFRDKRTSRDNRSKF